MKYAILRYSYNYGREKLTQLVNLGDYVQSLAAKQFLPQVDEIIDREGLTGYGGKEPIKMIMNGWYHFWEGNAVPSKNIIPLFVALHISNPQEVRQETLDYLKQHSPIGCRDFSTLNFLKEKGVDAYFSGCLTLTLGRTYSVPDSQRTNNVYFVDFDKTDFVNWWKYKLFNKVIVPPNLRAKTYQIIQERFPDWQNFRFIYRSHMGLKRLISEKKSFALADKYLRDYARAKLVVTRRIHCALPAAGMGTPSLLVMPNPKDSRFDELRELLNYVGVDTSGEFIEHLFLPENGQGLLNSPKIKEIAQSLSEKCVSFVKES